MDATDAVAPSAEAVRRIVAVGTADENASPYINGRSVGATAAVPKQAGKTRSPMRLTLVS